MVFLVEDRQYEEVMIYLERKEINMERRIWDYSTRFLAMVFGGAEGERGR